MVYKISKQYKIKLCNVPDVDWARRGITDTDQYAECTLTEIEVEGEGTGNVCGIFPDFGETNMWIYLKDLEHITPVSKKIITQKTKELDRWIKELT